MTPGIIDTLLLFFAVFLSTLYGMTFRFARGTMYGSYRDSFTTICDFASAASIVISLAAAVLLAIEFTWWVPILVLFLSTRAAVAVARRGEKMLLLMLGKFFLLAGGLLLGVVITRTISRLGWI
jgi:hypothetical protein|uniref:hypothetical protein n=1 Tax=Cephaloticoccus sp. TaxID=1985742 RepID=UPI00404911DD